MEILLRVVPAHVVEKERRFRIDQAIESGKPQEIAEKMVEGGMRKFFEEIALLEQPFIKDPDRKVRDLIQEQIATLGENITVRRFARFERGEDTGGQADQE